MIKRITSYLIIFASLLFLGCGIPKQTDPKVFLVGTVHNKTNSFNADSIYSLLIRYKPDLILMELDSSFFYEDFTYRTLFEGNEMIASVRYKMNFPQVNIRPIELEGREEIRQQLGVFPEITNEFGQILNTLIATHKLNQTEKAAIEQLFYYDSIATLYKTKTLREINQTKVDVISDSLNYFKYFKLKEIADKYDLFETTKLKDAKGDSVSIRKNFELYVDFEMNQRNNSLAKNSIEHINQNPTKKVMILVGFSHRYYLLDKLKNQKIQVQCEF